MSPSSSYFLVLLFHFQSERSADVAWSGIWISTWECSFTVYRHWLLSAVQRPTGDPTPTLNFVGRLFWFLLILAKSELFHSIFVRCINTDLQILFSLTESLVGSEIELFGGWQNPNKTITIEFSRAEIRSPPRPGARPNNWVSDSHHLSLLQNSFFLISSGFAFLIC